MHGRRALLALLFIMQFAGAQEDTAAPELLPLPADTAAELEQRIAEIGRQELIIEQLNESYRRAEGLQAELYAGRIDSVWSELFSDSVRLAQDVVSQQEKGFDVSVIAADLADRLSEFPQESVASLARLRESVVYPTDDMSPSELAIADQYLLRATNKFDRVLQSMIGFLTIADALGMQEGSFRASLVTDLENGAANRSTFLQLALEDVTVLRAASAALPTDEEVAARQAVHEARIRIATSSLQNIVKMMNQLDLDTSHYSQQLVTTTGELTSDALKVECDFRPD